MIIAYIFAGIMGGVGGWILSKYKKVYDERNLAKNVVRSIEKQEAEGKYKFFADSNKQSIIPNKEVKELKLKLPTKTKPNNERKQIKQKKKEPKKTSGTKKNKEVSKKASSKTRKG